MASLVEYERELIRKRTNAGLQSARDRLCGRQKGYTKLSDILTLVIADLINFFYSSFQARKNPKFNLYFLCFI